MRTSLYDTERDLGARFETVDGVDLPSDYGDSIAEHNAVARSGGIGLIDRCNRGKLVLTGRDRLDWLQGMISNDVRPLGQGERAICGCVLNATGHLLADVCVVDRGDSLLLDMVRANVDKVYRILDGFIITEDVEIVDQSDYLACLSLQGDGVSEGWVTGRVGNVDGVSIVPADHTGCGGVDIYMRATDAPATFQMLAQAGARPVGEAAVEMLRIEAGIPKYGADMDENTIPLECNLEATHISHDKGCYVGQEIVARIHARGHTNRALTGMVLEGAILPHHGHKIYPTSGDTARDVGWVTSSTHSPRMGRAIALGYVRHEYREPGTRLRIADADDAIPAVTTELPFRPAA